MDLMNHEGAKAAKEEKKKKKKKKKVGNFQLGKGVKISNLKF
jgi:hypothetical protein